jgi:hypothetical protein
MNQDLKRVHLLYKLCDNVWNPLSEITLSMDRSVYRVKESDGSVSVKVVVTGETAIDIAGRYCARPNLVPRACDPRKGTRGSGIIRFREESDWPLKWNA